ncbi:MAG: YeiH family protein [Candidatus Hodarchaeota archaeon]
MSIKDDTPNNDEEEAPQFSKQASSFIFILTLPILVLLAWTSNFLPSIVEPTSTKPVIEYVVYAVLLGLIISNLSILIPATRTPYRKFKRTIRTELLLKIGLVIYGGKIGADFAKLDVLAGYFMAAFIQAILVIITVFLVAYYTALKLFKLEAKFAAVLATAVSVCGVSAAIAAAGAVLAEKKQLAHTVTLVIAFSLPLMFIFPYLALFLRFPDAVAGAWIGGNIDTTAAVLAAGSIHGETAANIAAIVKITQNVLIGVVAFTLALYFSFYEKKDELRPSPKELWTRFPKFVLGFLLTMVLALPLINVIPLDVAKLLGNIAKWFFAMAFVCIGLSTTLSDFTQMGWKPTGAYTVATIYNTVLTLITAFLFFGVIFSG